MRSVGLCALAFALVACGARTELAGTKADASTSSACHDEVIATDAKGASALALDGDVVLWGTQDGLVRMRDAAGTTTTLAMESDTIASIAVGVVDPQNVYYAITGSIRRVPRAGGPVEEVLANAGIPFALTFASDHGLYFVDYGAGIAAGSVREILGLAEFELITGLDTPGGMAVDDDHVFVTSVFATTNQHAFTGPLFRADHGGQNLITLAENLHDPKSVVLYGGRVYFLEQTDASATLHGGVRSIAASGGATQVELATDGFLPNDVAVDESGVYATAYSQPKSSLFRASGGTTTELASTPGTFYEAVRTSATAVYWTIAWTSVPPADRASVRKLCK